MIRFPSPLIPGVLLKRYKRFLADVRLDDGKIVTAHTANSGSMMGLIEPGFPVYLSPIENPSAKLKYRWEIVRAGRVLVGVNTLLPNKLIKQAVEKNRIPQLSGYDSVTAEVKFGKHSRIDLLLSSAQRRCYVEIKNVTLAEKGVAYFPDAKTSRGLKHLKELTKAVQKGCRAANVYCVQRADAKKLCPAWKIDPEYARGMAAAAKRGVEFYAFKAKVRKEGVSLAENIPVDFGPLETRLGSAD